MKRTFIRILGMGVLVFAALTAQGAAPYLKNTLVIKADGSCQVLLEYATPRPQLELQVRMTERYRNSDEETPLVEPPATGEPKPFTDEELEKKVRAMYEDRGSSGDAATLELQQVKVEKESVRTVVSTRYATIEEFMSQSASVLMRAGFRFENLRVETDTNGLLRLTIVPDPDDAKRESQLRRQWKLTGAKNEFWFVLPGKIVSSSFPNKDTNATWLVIDGEKEETIDAVIKLNRETAVIVAESGSLKLPAPLDSKQLVRSAHADRSPYGKLPLTDAGPGFAAEALSVTMTTVHLFPEGEKRQQGARRYSDGESAGVQVRARVFAPKGRIVLAYNNPRVIEAKDNEGRKIELKKDVVDEEGDVAEESFDVTTSGRKSEGKAEINLPLGLPEAGAQAIDHLEGEVVLVTGGAWKELKVPDVKADTNKPIDLGAVLAGAQMIVTKVTTNNGQMSIELKLTGPPAVKQLRADLADKGEQENSHSSDRQTRESGGKVTRTVVIQSYSFGMNGPRLPQSTSVLVRLPDDVRRERVKFKLSALDLF